MAKLTMDHAVSVEDWIEDECDPDDAFDDCREDAEGVRDDFREYLTEILDEEDVKKLACHLPTFLEFDSGNWTHAAAYFQIEVEGPREILEKIVAAAEYELEIEE